jgi:hypothetical protein
MRISRHSLKLVLVTLVAVAARGIDVPSLGSFYDRAGNLRPVYGIPGSFVLGAPMESAGRTPKPLRDNFVTIEPDDIVVHLATGDKLFRVSSVTEVFHIGPHLLGARSDSETYALWLRPGQENVYVLPEN